MAKWDPQAIRSCRLVGLKGGKDRVAIPGWCIGKVPTQVLAMWSWMWAWAARWWTTPEFTFSVISFWKVSPVGIWTKISL